MVLRWLPTYSTWSKTVGITSQDNFCLPEKFERKAEVLFRITEFSNKRKIGGMEEYD